MDKKSLDSKELISWFSKEKRDLPWREEITPYKVWISEIMLQQTRASVVKDYFERWMRRFPTLSLLSLASEDEVIKLWEGLGYYNRARNILKAARYFTEYHGGIIPCDKDALLKVPGLGPYTVGAILSFAFQKKAAAVDGNVERVASRYFAIDEEISTALVKRKIEESVFQFLPDESAHVAMEGLIELGATLCSKTPLCEKCPLKRGCKARALGIEQELPKKKKAKGSIELTRHVVIIRSSECVLVRQNEPGRVLGGLYEFFMLQEEQDIESFFKEKFGIFLEKISNLEQQQHFYTHHKIELFPSIWETTHPFLVPGYEWRREEELKLLPFTSGHRKILAHLKQGKGK